MTTWPTLNSTKEEEWWEADRNKLASKLNKAKPYCDWDWVFKHEFKETKKYADNNWAIAERKGKGEKFHIGNGENKNDRQFSLSW